MDRQHFSFWFYILQYTFIMTEISCSFITKTFFFDTLYIWNEYQILQTIVSHTRSLHKKVSFPLLNLTKSTKNNSFFTFSEEIFNEKRYFLYSVYHCFVYHCVKSVQIWCFLWSVFFSYSVQIRKNTNQKKIRIWTLFKQFIYHKYCRKHGVEKHYIATCLALCYWRNYAKVTAVLIFLRHSADAAWRSSSSDRIKLIKCWKQKRLNIFLSEWK